MITERESLNTERRENKFSLLSENVKTYLLQFLNFNEIIFYVINLDRKFRNLKLSKESAKLFNKMLELFKEDKLSLPRYLMNGGEKLNEYVEKMIEEEDEFNKERLRKNGEIKRTFLRFVNRIDNNSEVVLPCVNSETLKLLNDFIKGDNLIKSLELIPYGANNWKENDGEFLNFVKYAKRLEHLNLSRCNIPGIDQLFDFLIEMYPEQRLVSLLLPQTLPDIAYSKLSDFLKITTTLKKFQAGNPSRYSLLEKCFLSGLIANQSITHLNLSNSHFTTENTELLINLSVSKQYEEISMISLFDKKDFPLKVACEFYALLNVRHLWVRRYISSDPYKGIKLLEALNKNSKIKEFTLNPCNMNDPLDELSSSELKSVSITGSITEIDDTPKKWENKELENVSLEFTGDVSEKRISTILRNIAGCPNIKKLSIKSLSNVQLLMNLDLGLFPNLEELVLTDIKVSSYNYNGKDSEKIPLACKLKKISFDSVSLETPYLLELLLDQQSAVEDLKLTNCKINDEGAKYLIEYLNTFGNKNLKTLALGSNSITKVGFQEIIDTLGNSSVLQHLNLRACPLYSAGVKSLLTLLQNVKTLEYLDVSLTAIKLEGCFELISFIEENQVNLKKLRMNSNFNFYYEKGRPLRKQLNEKLIALVKRRKGELEIEV